MHLFSSKQMDLNWEHEPMRRQIHEMIRWWLEKGVDGFRLDVINYISKAPGLPQGNPQIGNIMGYTGIEHYFYGPKLHAHLAEMRREAFDPFNAFSVGETPGIGLEMTKLLTSSKRKELDMAFCFDILETPGKARFDEYAYDPAYIKEYYTYWMEGLGSDCWMALFFNNHDNPRMVSKIDPESKSRKEVAKLLAMIQLTLRGTPFIYQGDELGAGNQMFKAIEDMRDVESLNLYQELLAKMDPEAAFKKVLSGTRDHARVPMQWEKDGGFTTGEPWIKGCLDGMDAASQLADEGSVLAFYRKLIELRRNNKALVYGDVAIAKGCGRKVFAYHRKLKSECFFICCNMSSREAAKPKIDGKLILSNWPDESGRLRPYEASLYKSV
jgi:oligo-1,6-glucosidase